MNCEHRAWAPFSPDHRCEDDPIEVKIWMPESLFASLARRADRESCSLSRLCSDLLTERHQIDLPETIDREADRRPESGDSGESA